MNVHAIQECFDDARIVEWPEADHDYLGSADHATPALPPGLFGPIFKVLEDLADDCSAPVDYVAHAFLAVCGSLLSGRVRVRPFDTSTWMEPPVLWIGLVGDPSSRKSPALDATLRPLYKVQEAVDAKGKAARKNHQGAELYSQGAEEKYKQDVRAAARAGRAPPERPIAADPPSAPAVRRLFVSDITIEALGDVLSDNPEGTLCKRDELIGWYDNIDRYHSGSRPFWIEAYNAGSHVIDRRIRDEPLRIPSVCVSIVGTIQPDMVDKILSGPADGFAARMLFAWPEMRTFEVPSSLVDDGALAAVYEKLECSKRVSAKSGRLKPEVVPLTTDAASRFTVWLRAIEQETSRSHGHYAGFLGKAGGTVLRVSVIAEFVKATYAGLSAAPREVTLATLEDAIEWMDHYAKPMALKVYGAHRLEPAERNARLLLAYLGKLGQREFNKRELMRSPHKSQLPGMRKSAQFEAAIALLEEAGWVRKKSQETTGRPRCDYIVNPSLRGLA